LSIHAEPDGSDVVTWELLKDGAASQIADRRSQIADRRSKTLTQGSR